MATAGTARLIEREAETAQLEAALDAAAAGAGRLLVLEGPAGIGKTRLVGVAADAAAARGFTVGRATGAELERDLPYGCVLQLLARPVAALAADERAVVTAGAAATGADLLAGGGAVAGADPVLPLLHGLHWLCANLAERAPLLLALDDAHHADPQSLRVLGYLAARVTALPVVLLVARRAGVDAPPELDALLAAAGTPVRPAALSAGAVATVVRGAFPDVDEAFAAACHQLTGGNPLYLDALLRTVRADGLAPDAASAARLAHLPVEAVGRAVLGEVAGLGAAASALACAVAVLGDGMPLHLVARLAGVSADEAAEAADRLARAGVLTPGDAPAFTHPIVREAVYGDLPAAARARDHLRAAALVGEPAEVVAAHLLRGARSGEAWAVDELRAAAASARERGAPDVAVRYLRRALEEGPPRAVRVHVLRELGAAQALTFEPAAVEHLREAWSLAQAPDERSAVALELGRALIMQGRLGECVEVCDAAAREPGADRETVLRLETDLIGAARLDLSHRALSTTRLRALAPDGGQILFPNRSDSGPSSESPVDPASPDSGVGKQDLTPGVGAAGRLVLANLAYEHALAGRDAAAGAALARRALDDGGLLRTETSDSPTFYLASNALTLCERFDEAEATFAAAVAEAWGRGSALAFAIASCFRGDALNRAGNPREGARHAAASIDAAEAHGWALGLPAAVGFLIDALLDLGELDAAAQALVRAPLTAGELPDNVFFTPVLFSRGRLRIAQGALRDGIDDVLEAGRRQQAWGCPNPSVIPWRSTAALGLLQLGDAAQARALAADELRDAEAFGAPRALLMSRRAAALAAGGDVAIDALREAVAACAPADAPLERARAQADLGAALRRAGHRRDARTPLADALDTAARLGAAPVAAFAESELRAAGARPRTVALRGADALTPSERRVAALAAEGLSNPDIAQRLFVTRRTVETHLTSTYRKLGVASRAELAAQLVVG